VKYCDVDFQSAFQSYVNGNDTDKLASSVPPGSCGITGVVQPGILAADAAELQTESHISTSDAAKQQQSTTKLNISSHPVECSSFSSSSHSLVSMD